MTKTSEYDKIAQSKKQLRKEFLDLRKQMLKEDGKVYSMSICNNILDSEYYTKANQILAYMPIRNEVDVVPVIKESLKNGKDVFLPKVHGNEMTFYKVNDLEELVEGRFSILEPKENEPLHVKEGLLLVPGVAFSKKGFRIGYGGGFYDRYLAEEHGFTTMGISYEFQLYDDLKEEPFDQQLDMIVTEKTIYKIKA